MDLLVREATFEDAELIASLTRQAWAEKPAPHHCSCHETAETVTQHLQRGGGFLLYVNEVPVGTARWLPLDEDPGTWEIVRLGIIPAYRGHGLSQHLLEAVVHEALTADADELRVAVDNDQTRLVDLYAAHRFDIAMELEYSDAQVLEPQAIVMRRELR